MIYSKAAKIGFRYIKPSLKEVTFYNKFDSSKFCFQCKGTLFKRCCMCNGSGKIFLGGMKECLCECYNKITFSYGKVECHCISKQIF